MLKYLVLLLLTGCTIAPKSPAPVSTFDFGPISRIESAQLPTFSSITLQVADVIAPTWLDTRAMRYRLAYHHPAQTHAYANNRWAASPASLLTERIKQHITSWQNPSDRSGRNARPIGNYTLAIELEEFIQVFETVDRSHAIVSLRARLVERDTRLPVAQKRFSRIQITPSADASGAAEAFIAISDHLTAELIQWSAERAGYRPASLK
ncbi:MAG: ABC-type transport auxiliary lipoprotein family protein [Nitrosomonas sp.]|nr:ABC-type transport auxiliary lipoprotein family protein [Nitrosomonas sp.]